MLAEAAIGLIEEKGFDAVTISEIVEKVGIARRTFFLYFETKEDVLIQWLEEEWVRATEQLLTKHVDKAPFDAYCAALMELGAHFDRGSDRARVITRITLENPSVFGREYVNQFGWQARWAERLREVQKKPKSRMLAYEVQAATAFAVVAVAARRWVDDSKRQSFCAWLEKGFNQVRLLSVRDIE